MKLREKKDLRHYQGYMVDRIVNDRYVMLWADMGLGKTVATLTGIQQLLDMRFITKVLIVAPLLVATTTWPDEIEAWAHTRHLTYTVIRVEDDDPRVRAAYNETYKRRRAEELMLGAEPDDATRIARAAAQRAETEKKEELKQALVMEDTQVHIINREQLIWLVEFLGKRRPYDALVYDEASRLKAGKKRVKPSKKLGPDGKPIPPGLSEFGAVARMRAGMDCVIELTGTPSPNGLEDLWGQAYIADLGKRLGTSKSAFLQRWFDCNKYDHSIKPKHFAEEAIMRELSDIAVTLRSEDYIALPGRVDNFVYVDLPEQALEKYRRFQREFVLEEHDIEAVNQGVLTNKLLQLSNGSVYDGDKKAIGIHDEKLGALERIIEEANGKPVLIAYSFQFDLDKIRKKFKHAVLLRDERDVVRKWNAGKIPLLITHPASAAHGLNLQYGGNIAVWYGLTWSLELYQQFNKRLDRSGQLFSVILHHILTRGTYDEIQLKALNFKDATQNSVTQAVRLVLPATS
ncbi:DNA helicase [Achromobacter phage vB_AchrS_AchV4]|uniref:DNA helicase n=1 Tax=Achromobacter phage vB_AchrS_AchV4 TaxID=2796514 RepID=A0A7T3U6U1_9CAUD|nr:DNA helicase [Achromobacter phage vB_AchrS_AchV4]QPZ53245.1 DNA helicase [Achromobacter phage vB_AchrS_AchV4]